MVHCGEGNADHCPISAREQVFSTEHAFARRWDEVRPRVDHRFGAAKPGNGVSKAELAVGFNPPATVPLADAPMCRR